MRSRDAKCHCSSSSAFLTRSSCSKIETVLSVDRRNISLTPINRGLLSSMIQPKGEMEVSQAVNAKRASMVLSGEMLGGRWIRISTSAAVLSSIRLILIFPLSLAFKIESISDEVVVLNGIWRITKVFLSSWATLARTRILPPRKPSLYCPTSITPPVGKSGYNSNRFPFRCLIDASISSIKLCGRILVDSPTAIPSPPCASSNGNFTGRWIGSFFRPSYDNCHCVTLGL